MGGSHRLADAAALTGLSLALLALLAVGAVYLSGPLVDLLQGPDPCGAAKGVRAPDTACVLAHPDYYQYEPATGSVSARGWLIAQTLDDVAWRAAPPLALAASLISWLALAMGTGRRRTALSGLTISALIALGMGFFLLVLVGGGGD
jgi:hypothetical protein